MTACACRVRGGGVGVVFVCRCVVEGLISYACSVVWTRDASHMEN